MSGCLCLDSTYPLYNDAPPKPKTQPMIIQQNMGALPANGIHEVLILARNEMDDVEYPPVKCWMAPSSLTLLPPIPFVVGVTFILIWQNWKQVSVACLNINYDTRVGFLDTYLWI